MPKKSRSKYLKTLLATSCLAIGVIAGSAYAAKTVSPNIGSTAKFSADTNWVQYIFLPPILPVNSTAPVSGDSVTFYDAGSTVVADVSGVMINNFTSGLLTAPGVIRVEQPFVVTNGMVTTTGRFPVNIATNTASFEASTQGMALGNVFSFNAGFADTATSGRVILSGNNIDAAHVFADFTGTNPNVPAGIVDFAGTSAGTNITFSGNISNILDVIVRANNNATFLNSVAITRDFTIADKAAVTLALSKNLTAGRIVSSTANSTLNLAGNNVVNAKIGQNGDTPLNAVNIISGTATFNQSLNANQVTLPVLPGTLIMGLNTNLTSATGLQGNGGALTLNGNNVVNAPMLTSYLATINLASGTGTFNQSINATGNVSILGNGANLILAAGANLTAANIVGNVGNSTLTLNGANVIDAKSGITTLALGSIALSNAASATLKQSMKIAQTLNLGSGSGLTINNSFTAGALVNGGGNGTIFLQGANTVFNTPMANKGLPIAALSVLSGQGTITQYLGCTGDVALGNAATLILNSDLVAARITGDNTNNIILNGNNTVAAVIGQPNLLTINNISLLAGTGTLTKATNISGDFILSPSTNLILSGAANNQTFTADGIQGNNTNNLSLASFTILNAQIGSGAPYNPLNNITLLGSGYGSFIKPITIIGDVILQNNAPLVIAGNLTAARIIGTSGNPSFNGTLRTSGANIIVDALIGQNGDAPLTNMGVALGKTTLVKSANFVSGIVLEQNTAELALGANVTLKATSITALIQGSGVLTLLSNNIVDAVLSGGSNVVPLNTINVINGDNQFKQLINITGDVVLNPNSTVTFSDSLTAARVTGNATNTLTFKGNNVVINAKIGQNADTPLGQININGTFAEFKQGVNIVNNYVLAANSTVKFDGNVQGNTIIAPAGNTATVEFGNTSALQPQVNIGDVNGINTVMLSGVNVEFTNATNVRNIRFNNASLATAAIFSNNFDLGATNVSTASTTQRNHQIHVKVDQNITGNIGSAANLFGAIKILNNNRVNIGTTNFYSDVLTATDNTGVVAFVVPNSFSYDLGDSTHKLSDIIFLAPAEVRGRAYSNNVHVVAGITAGFKGRGTGENAANPLVQVTNPIELQGGGASVVFGASAQVNASIVSTAVGTDNVRFEATYVPTVSNSVMVGDLGTNANPLGSVQINGNTEIDGSVYASQINIGGQSIATFLPRQNVPSTVQTTNGIILQEQGSGAEFGNNTQVNSDILTTNDGQGIVIFWNDVNMDGNLGAPNNQLALVEFQGNMDLQSKIYAKKLAVAADKQVNFLSDLVDGPPILQVQDGIELRGGTATVTFDDGTELTSRIYSTVDSTGSVIFKGKANVIGDLGDNVNPLFLVNFGGDADFQGDVYALKITVAAGATTDFNSLVVKTFDGIELQGAGASAVFGDNITLNSPVFTTVNNTGEVVFGNNPMINGALGDATNFLSMVTFNGDAMLSQSAYAQRINVALGRTVNFNSPVIETTDRIELQGAGATAVFGDNAQVDSPILTTVNNTGEVIFGNNPMINGSLGNAMNSLALVTFNGDATLTQNAYVQKLTIAAGHTVNFNSPIVQAGDRVELQGAGATVNFADNSQVNSPILTTVNNTGNVSFGENPVINGPLGDNVNYLGLVAFNGDATLTQNIYTQNVTVASGHTVDFNVQAGDVTGSITLQGQNAAVIFHDNVTLNSAILTTENNNGNVSFGKNTTINGALGDAMNALGLVTFNGDATLIQSVYAQTINVAGDYTINFNSPVIKTTEGIELQGALATAVFGDNAQVNSPVLTTVNNKGTVIFGNNPMINGSLGAATNFLSTVTFNGDATLMQSAYAQTINVAGGHTVNFNSPVIETTDRIELQGAGATAVFGDNAQIDTPILTTANDTGNVVFGNNPMINGSLGDAGNSLALVDFNGNATLTQDAYAQRITVAANRTVDFNAPIVQTTTGIELEGPAATAVFGDNAQVSSNILAAQNGAGNVVFNGNNATMNGNLGAVGNAVESVNFNGNTEVLGQIYTGNINVASNAAANLREAVQTNNVNLSGSGASVRFLNNANIMGNILTNADGTGDIIFDNTVNMNGDFGSVGNSLNLVQFNSDFNLTNSTYTRVVGVGAGKTINFNTSLAGISNRIELQGSNATARFVNNADLDSRITSTVNNTGNVIFEDNLNLNTQLGEFGSRLGTVTFNAASSQAANNTVTVINLNKDIHAANININRSIVNLTSSRTLDGTVNMSNPTISLGQNTLTFTGGNSSITGNSTFNVDFNNASNSYINVSQAQPVPAGVGVLVGPDSLDMSGSNVTFNINDTSPATPQGTTTVYNVFGDLTNVNYTPNANVTVNDNNNFAIWTYQNGVLIQTSNVSGGIGGVIGDPNNPTPISQNTANNINMLTDPNLYGDALELLIRIGKLDRFATKEEAARALLQVFLAINPTAEAVTAILKEIDEVNKTRIDNVVYRDLRIHPGMAAPIAAGDKVMEDYAVWAEPFYSTSLQKNRADQPGYKTEANGLTLGMDTSINDKSLVGLSVSMLKSRIHYRNFKAGDKSNIDSFMLSLYGMHEIHDDWFGQTILSIGTNKVKNSKPRSNGEVARGRYRSTSYSAELSGGYRWNIVDNAILTPTAGAKYSRFDSENYGEKDTINDNLRIKKKPYQKFDLLFGGRLNTAMQYCNYELTPQLHAFMNYDLTNKSAKALVNLDGLSSPFIPLKMKKPVRTYYDTGAALALTKTPMEYEVSYNFRFGEKYKGHQVALKVRARF